MAITLATLHLATAQQVFDQVVNHLVNQRRRSMNGKQCAYRSVDGLRCAAGCLIADYEYKIGLEGNNWVALAFRGEVPETHMYLIHELQICHDISETNWVEDLEHTANVYGLEFDVRGFKERLAGSN